MQINKIKYRNPEHVTCSLRIKENSPKISDLIKGDDPGLKALIKLIPGTPSEEIPENLIIIVIISCGSNAIHGVRPQESVRNIASHYKISISPEIMHLPQINRELHVDIIDLPAPPFANLKTPMDSFRHSSGFLQLKIAVIHRVNG